MADKNLPNAIIVDSVPARTRSIYPEPFAARVLGGAILITD